MLKKTLTLTLLVAALAATTGCQDARQAQREALAAQLGQADNQQQTFAQAVAQRESRIASLKQELDGARAGKDQFNERVKAYMLEHKMAVAAIAAGALGGSVALSDDSEYSTDAREIGAVVGLLALGYAVFNSEEVTDVFNQLMKADRAVKDMAQHEQQLAASIQREDSALQGERAQVQALSGQVVQIRAALQAL